MVVVLPAPFGPRMPVTAPPAADSVSPSTAARSPYRLTSPPISTAGAAGFAGVCGAALTHASLRRSPSVPGHSPILHRPSLRTPLCSLVREVTHDPRHLTCAVDHWVDDVGDHL